MEKLESETSTFFIASEVSSGSPAWIPPNNLRVRNWRIVGNQRVARVPTSEL